MDIPWAALKQNSSLFCTKPHPCKSRRRDSGFVQIEYNTPVNITINTTTLFKQDRHFDKKWWQQILRKILLLMKSPNHTLRLVGVVSGLAPRNWNWTKMKTLPIPPWLLASFTIWWKPDLETQVEGWSKLQGLYPHFCVWFSSSASAFDFNNQFSLDHKWWSRNRMIGKHFFTKL